ncbi:MAG: hypothetical protein H6835_19730 [Planctomycetes bacterium]|nr:hypothetical protein [Planctomycetota bacterium]
MLVTFTTPQCCHLRLAFDCTPVLDLSGIFCVHRACSTRHGGRSFVGAADYAVARSWPARRQPWCSRLPSSTSAPGVLVRNGYYSLRTALRFHQALL